MKIVKIHKADVIDGEQRPVNIKRVKRADGAVAEFKQCEKWTDDIILSLANLYRAFKRIDLDDLQELLGGDAPSRQDMSQILETLHKANSNLAIMQRRYLD